MVAERFDLHAGGAERSAAQIAVGLTRRGHRVTIIAGSCPDPQALPDVTVLAMTETKSASLIRFLRFVRWARRQLARGRFDVSLSLTTAVPATVVEPRNGTVRETLRRNIAVGASWKGRFAKRIRIGLGPKYHAQLAMERRTLADPSVSRIVAISHYVIDQLCEHYRLDPERIELIPNGSVMTCAGQAQNQAWRQQIRRTFAIPEGSVVYLFAAMNPRLKGFESLMGATKCLKQRGVKPILLLAGNLGYAEQQQVSQRGLRDQVRFVGRTATMAPLYATADATVLPTYYDPASKVVIESLMMGTPAISTSFNGSSDLIEPDGQARCGRVIADPADVEALVSAMAELADPVQRSQFALATAGLAEALSMERHVSRLEPLLGGATVVP